MTRSTESDFDIASEPKVVAKLAEARALGAAWAIELQAALRAENRRAAGGWPGTMREASVRIRRLTGTADLMGRVSLNQQVSEQLTRALYSSAKATWCCHSEPEERDADVESQASY